jgi:RES domain-containing protein
MKVYRVVIARYASDLNGTGGLYTDGRWHRQGHRILYTAQSKALAILEKLVHLSRRDFSMEHRCLTIQFPDEALQDFPVAQLPPQWNSRRGPEELKELGTKWLLEKKSLALRVPSVLVPGEFNILINPLHPLMQEIALVENEPLLFDERLRKE